jgi:gliding motility-associated-like protein
MNGLKLRFAFVLLLFAQSAFCQLSNFTLTVTKTDETCTANGSLTFSVSNTTSGATMLYSIYLLPNVTTPISFQSGTSISGLSAGNYRVVATQSLGNQSGTQQQDITIVSLLNPLSYQIDGINEVCGNDGTITVNVTSGTAFNYEILSGPMTRPLQSSNVFTGLTAGVYLIRVFDTCNQGLVQTFTLSESDTALNLNMLSPNLASCTSVNIGFSMQSVLPSPAGVVRYPIQVVTTLFLPTGTVTHNNTITMGNSFSEVVPYFATQPYAYSFTITDGCGTVYTLAGSIPTLTLSEISYTVAPQDCIYMLIGFSNVTALTLLSAPATYAGAVPQNFTPLIVNNRINIGNLTPGTYVFNATDMCGVEQQMTIVVVLDDQMGTPPYTALANVTCIDATAFIYDIEGLIMISAPPAYTVPLPHDYTSIINSANYASFVHLPGGTYIFQVIDLCGNPRPLTVIISPEPLNPTAAVLEGCENGVGSVLISGQFTTISLTSAPAAYNVALPHNFTGNTTSGGTRLALNMLPPGNYVFESTDACDNTFITNMTILGYQESTNVTVSPNCGSFNLQLAHTSNNNVNAGFWLQKYNPLTNSWGHPLTNINYPDNTVPNAANSFPLTNNAINYNLAYSGHLRILKAFKSYSSGTSGTINCFRVLYEFDFSDAPRINDVYSVSCGSVFEVIVNAQGNSALIYRIITKNGQPFLVENGSSSVFTGLDPAIYVFQVEDACHNSVNSQFEIANPNPMEITATPILCNGDNVILSVPNFPFLTYQWWKDNNTATVLSTANTMQIASFNSATDNGIYHVRVSYAGNPNSCLNQVLDYAISINNAVANAGNDNSVSYCGRQGVIDLSGLLSGSFDPNGTWSEITSSNMLTDNWWDSSAVLFGTYQFKYQVTGTCNSSDEALIDITIKAVPQVPVASVDPIVCETQDLNLFATTVTNAAYHWVGPNGFVSEVQNPTINSISGDQNGIYTVYATENECQSGDSSISVLVNPLPDFVLSQGCVGREYQLWATSLNEISYDEANSIFNWNGPNNFTGNHNPITITGGAPGIYSLTIINEHGCQTTNPIEVGRTICFIPNAITPNNDGTNESLDLTGFDVTKLEIYSRWGRKVYEKNNYVDEWHGQNMNGGILPDSTYYYIIELGSDETKTGWIFLSRG